MLVNLMSCSLCHALFHALLDGIDELSTNYKCQIVGIRNDMDAYWVQLKRLPVDNPI